MPTWLSDWWPLIALLGTLLAGGAGALLNQWFTTRRSAHQPIAYTIQAFSLLSPQHTPAIQLAYTAVGAAQVLLRNVYLVTLELTNIGNSDLNTFNFGVTFPYMIRCILVEGVGADRHHEVRYDTSISPDEPTYETDFTLTPFNRTDRYAVQLYVTSDMAVNRSEVIPELSSAAAVKLVVRPANSAPPIHPHDAFKIVTSSSIAASATALLLTAFVSLNSISSDFSDPAARQIIPKVLLLAFVFSFVFSFLTANAFAAYLAWKYSRRKHR